MVGQETAIALRQYQADNLFFGSLSLNFDFLVFWLENL
jgi:hypothetical protein